jgi:hypothetical protein
MGSEVSFSDEEAATVGRFGRRPPGSVLINGATLPLRYSIDVSRIFEDVILQPQGALQARLRLNEQNTTWLGAEFGPSPEASAQADGFVRVDGNGVDAVAVVRPSFERVTRAHATHRFDLESLALIGSAQFVSDGTWGGELATELAPFARGKLRAAYSDSNHTGTIGLYTQRLFSLETQYELNSEVSFYAGAKTHLRPELSGNWLRAGVEKKFAEGRGSIDVGTDLFAGTSSSFFGEWRTNDRLYLTLSWRN